jgi:hypothetical protein
MAAMAFACFSFNIKLGVKLYHTCVQYLCYMLRCTVLMLYVLYVQRVASKILKCKQHCERNKRFPDMESHFIPQTATVVNFRSNP